MHFTKVYLAENKFITAKTQELLIETCKAPYFSRKNSYFLKERIKSSLARNLVITPFIQKILANDEDRGVKRNLALNPLIDLEA